MDVYFRLGDDQSFKTDDSVKILSVRDENAELIDFAFTCDCKTVYVHIQHSSDEACVAGIDYASHDFYVKV